MLGTVAFFLILYLGVPGCSAPLGPVVYSGPDTMQSQLTAMVGFKSGIVTGGQKTETGEGPYPKLYFEENDQRVFAESLTAELNRIGLLDAAFGSAGSDGENYAFIHIIFKSTFPGGLQENCPS